MDDGIDIYGNYILPAATGVKNAAISLFAPSAVASGDYSAQAAEYARQQKLADMLSQMGAQEQAVSTAGGITAPVSPMGALARGLTSFGGAYLSGKAAGDQAALKKAETADALAQIGKLYTLPDTTGLVPSTAPAGTTSTPFTVGMPTLPGQKPSDVSATANLDLPNAPGVQTATIPGGARPYADQLKMLNKWAIGDNAVLAAAAPTLAAQLKPEYKDIGAGGLAQINSDGTVSTVVNPKPTKSFMQLTPEEVAKGGLPKGTIALAGSDGNIEIKYNPTANAISESMLAIAQQNLGLNQQRFNADQTAKASGVFDSDTLRQMAEQAWTGDKSVFQNLGRGTQGAQNIVNLRKAMYQYGAEHGKTPTELASMNNTYQGALSEQRTLGTTGAKIGSANAGLDIVLDQANEAYNKLGRGNFVPFNRLQQMATTNAFSTPEQADAYAADVGAVNMWAKAINPSGVLTVENARRGTEMLNSAASPDAHKAVLERMRKEGAAAKKGVDVQRGIGGATGGAAAPGAGGGTTIKSGRFTIEKVE